MWYPAVVLIILFLPLYFPDGRLLSPRWRPVLWLALLFSVGFGVVFGALWPGELGDAPGVVGDVPGVVNPLGIEALRPLDRVIKDIYIAVLFLVIVLCSVASLVVRFRRSSGEERQQMKWLTYAVAANFALLLGLLLPSDLAWYSVVASLSNLVLAGIPVAVGIAVLRYRLYDIDVIINRTLVYGSLTALLALVYFGGVAVTEAVFRVFTEQEEQPQLVVVVSTLVIAALFNPLRRRIQSFIDRRFYRRKYDARKTLGAFSAKLREEPDLDSLNAELVGVVRETMQPAHVSL
jgi:hypothetical protein